MAITYSAAARNAQLDALDTLIGTSGRLHLRESTTTRVTINLNNPAFAVASSGAITLNVSPALSANAASGGTIDNFQIDDGTTVHISGSVSTTAAGTGDLQLDNTSVTTGQSVSISSGTITGGNA